MIEDSPVPLAKPKGSNSGTGSREPGNPHAKAFSSGVHPFKVAERAEERTVWLDGAKAAADAARVAEKASFMMNYYGRSEEIVNQW
jgi:hypothetical protein